MNPLFQKKTNDEQDPIILPQDDNQQGDMLDPATQQVVAPPPVAPAEDEKVVEQSRMAAQKSAAAHTPWDVYLRGKWVNRVFTVPNMTADDVKRGLVDHDGLNPAIEVRSGQGRNVPGSVPLNRIGSNPLLQKRGAGAPIGMDQDQQTCRRCKQPIQQGQMVSWESGSETHAGVCPPPPPTAVKEQSRLMFPKGYEPKQPPTAPQRPQKPPTQPQYASAEKVATRRKISGYVPATSWGVPQECAHQVAHALANAGVRDFDVATDEKLHVAYFSFGNEVEMEVSADIVCEYFGPQIAASKGKWIGWQCRPERQPRVPDVNMPLSKMNSKRAGSQGTREAVAKLQRLGIKTTADLDKWIKEHPKTETKGPYAGSRSLMSRYDALNELVGTFAATWILHDLATDAAVREGLPKRGFFSPEDAKRFRDDNQGSNVALNQDEEGSQLWEKVPDNELLRKKEGAVPPPPPQPPASHVREAPAPRKPAPPQGSPNVTFPSDMPDIYIGGEPPRGAPADFGGAVFPNPKGLAPTLDTAPPPPRPELNATHEMGVYKGDMKMDMTNADVSDVVPNPLQPREQ